MSRLAGWATYAAFVVANLLYVYLCPAELAPAFLTAYPLAGFAAGIVFTIFYTTHRNRLVDVAAALVFLLTGLLYVVDAISPLLAFGVLAAGMIMSDYSVAQSKQPCAVVLARALSAAAAIALFWDFEVAVALRLLVAGGFCGYGAATKSYEAATSEPDGVASSLSKWIYAVLSGILYFGPLSLVVHLVGHGYREMYIAYAAAGNIILKTLDFDIKQVISGGETLPAWLFNLAALGAVAIVLAGAALTSWPGVGLALPLVGLIMLRGVVGRARWN